MKKKRSIALVLALVLAFGTGVVAKEVFENVKAQIRPDFVIEIDGVEREFKNADGERVYPILHNGTTYLPIRAIGEIMGKTVYWYESEKRIELKDEKESGKTTVTDADVIVSDGDKKTETAEKEKVTSDKSGVIGEEKAKEIALRKAELKEADVKFIRVELDRDDGILKYEIEFRKELTEYEIDVNADDGSIIKFEKELDD